MTVLQVARSSARGLKLLERSITRKTPSYSTSSSSIYWLGGLYSTINNVTNRVIFLQASYFSTTTREMSGRCPESFANMYLLRFIE
jgi:hypothetical protein